MIISYQSVNINILLSFRGGAGGVFPPPRPLIPPPSAYNFVNALFSAISCPIGPCLGSFKNPFAAIHIWYMSLWTKTDQELAYGAKYSASQKTLRGWLHLHFGCVVWICVSLRNAFSMSFSGSKSQKWHLIRNWQWNAQWNCTLKRHV
jgi:hypothetical protein